MNFTERRANTLIARSLSSFLRGTGAMLCAALMVLVVGVAPAVWSRDLYVTVLDAPPGQSIEVHAVSLAGQLGGEVKDHQGTHGLLCSLPCNAQVMRPIDLWFNGEKAVSTQIRSMAVLEQIAGSFIDRTNEGQVL
jgi:hypothetical protein